MQTRVVAVIVAVTGIAFTITLYIRNRKKSMKQKIYSSNEISVENEYKKYSQDYTKKCQQKQCTKIARNCFKKIDCGDIVYCALLLNQNMIATSHPHTPWIKIWDIEGNLTKIIDIEMTEVWEMVRTGDNLLICASSDAKCLKIINWHSGEILNTITHTAGISVGGHKTLHCFGDQNQYLIACLFNKTMVVWDIRETGGKIVKNISGHDGWVTCIEVLPHGKIATGSGLDTIKIWDFESGKLEATLKGHHGTVNTLCLLSENMLVSGGFDHTIQLWDLKTMKRERVVCTSGGSIRQVYGISESYFVSASSDKTAKVWELSMNQCVANLKGHTNDVVSIDILDGMIITGAKDKTVRIWK
jgi:WD40 repeat protein